MTSDVVLEEDHCQDSISVGSCFMGDFHYTVIPKLLARSIETFTHSSLVFVLLIHGRLLLGFECSSDVVRRLTKLPPYT